MENEDGIAPEDIEDGTTKIDGKRLEANFPNLALKKEDIELEKDTQKQTIIPAGLGETQFAPPKDRLTLEQIAELLGQEKKTFIDLYDEKFEEWKVQSDGLCKVAIKTINQRLSENEFISPGEEDQTNYFTFNKEVALTLKALLTTPEREIEKRSKAYASGYKLEPHLGELASKSESYEKDLAYLINLLFVKSDIEWYYSKAVMHYNVIQNNNLSNIWNEAKSLEEIMKEIPAVFETWNVAQMFNMVPRLLVGTRKLLDIIKHALNLLHKEKT